MSERNVYAVAVLVTKLPPDILLRTDRPSGALTYHSQEAEPSSDSVAVEHALLAFTTIAGSEEEAKEKCLRGAREAYPESEGWNFFNASSNVAFDVKAFGAALRGELNPRFLSTEERDVLQAVLLDLLIPEVVTSD
jgi:hypothetical protein